jgi:hypothetical protein
VSRYAPKSDNPESFENYIKYMSDKLGVDPDEEIDLAGRRAELIPAIVGFEQGQQPFSEDQISRAITASQTDDPDEVSSILNAPLNEVLADRGVNSSDLFQQDVDSGLMSAMAASNQPAPQASSQNAVTQADIDAMLKRQQGLNLAPQDFVQPKVDPGLLAALEAQSSDDADNAFGTSGIFAGVERGIPSGAISDGETDSTVTPTQPTTTTPPAATATDEKQDTAERSGIDYLTGGADEISSIESEILKMQQQLGKERETDKWLAIAQAGLSLMSSKEPTLLGAAGEAGVEGLKAFREAQTRYQEGVIDLLNARAKIKDDKKGMTSSSAVSRLNKIQESLYPNDPAAMPLPPEEKARLEEEAKYLRREILGYKDIVA